MMLLVDGFIMHLSGILDFDRSIVAFCGQIVINKYKYIIWPLIIDIF